MLKNYFKIAWRNLAKYKSFSLINIMGLTLGLSSIMVLGFMLYQFLTANNQFQNKERLYYIRQKGPDGNGFNKTPYKLLDKILETCPEVTAGTHFQGWNRPWLKNGNKEFQESTWYVDTAFFSVFSYPLEYGNAATALHDKSSLVLSHEMAEKLFGTAGDAVGKTVTADDSLSLTVTGVLRSIPSNTTKRPEVLLTTALLADNRQFSPNADWYNSFAENYLLLKPGADTAKLNTQLNQIARTNFHAGLQKNKLILTPFRDFVKNEAGDIVQVIIKGEAGAILFILLIMVANLINLNAATMFSRAKEVAVKKMMGSTKRQIILQFCIENGLIVLISIGLALIVFNALLLPQINTLIESRFGSMVPDLNHDYPLAFWFIGGSILIVIIAGSYPAFHLTSLKVTDVIKGKLTGTNKKQVTRNSFIVLQFVLAITFIGVTVILSRQMHHMKNAALGFNKEDILVVPMDLSFKNQTAAHARFDVLLNDLRNNPYVKNISTSENIPTAYDENYNNFTDPVSGKEISMRQASTDAGLIPAYQVHLIEGRNFRNLPANQEKNNILINRTAMKALGWDHATGKQLKSRGSGAETLTVIGVMEDFHYQDLSQNVEPLIHFYADKQQLGYAYLSIRIDPAHTRDIVNQVQQGFAAMPSRRSFSYAFLNSRIDQQYALLNGILKVTNYVSLLTIFIAAMGLFGLVALFTKQRVKEIGIRKVLGAEVTDIIVLLSQNYIALIVLASGIATPIVWFIMGRWLQDFAYRITINWWMPLLAGLVALLAALCIVLYQAVRAASANPVKSLRTE